MHRNLSLLILMVWGCLAGAVSADPELDCARIPVAESHTDLRCGSIEVPENHSNPNGRILEITYVVIAAENSEPNEYPLIHLTGGPGAKTLTAGRLTGWSSHPARRDRDIILFDQRGVGYSSALPDMSAEVFEVLAADADEEEEFLWIERVIRKYRDLCESSDIRLEYYNTFQSSRDTRAVMQHLGYDRYNIYATSYGTRLARVVQSEHPDLIHAVVQNSPNSMTEDFLGNRLEGYSLALGRVLNHCKQDVECSRLYPELEASYLAAIRQLIEEPLTVDFQGRGFVINAQDGTFLMRRALYRASSLEVVPKAIQELQGGGGETLVALLEYEWSLNELINYSMLLSVERSETFDPSATSVSIDGVYSRLPLLPVKLGLFDAFYRSGMVWHDATLPSEARRYKSSDRPTLILVNQFDPATPPESALRFQTGLTNSRLLILDQGGHGGGQEECKNRVMVQFLNDPTGPLDSSCLQLVEP